MEIVLVQTHVIRVYLIAERQQDASYTYSVRIDSVWSVKSMSC